MLPDPRSDRRRGLAVGSLGGPDRDRKRPDVIRSSGPFLAGEEGGDATALWHNTAAGKYSLELDIASEAGREVVFDLARWADLAYESFSAGALDRLGLGYATLREVNPRLVMISTSLLGQTGPLARFAGFGNLAAAMVAAVDHAGRTGVGQYLDISQAEAAIHLLAPALLAQQLDGVTATRSGNADPVLTPHGVFPAGDDGQDRWLAIACHDDAWPALVEVAGLDASWVGWDNARRRAEEVTVEAALSAWTAGQDCDEMTERLQAVGVAAHSVQHTE